MITANDILSFWFVETDKSFHFKKSDAFDAKIRGRFEDMSIRLAAEIRQPPHDWEQSPESTLALIIALDQFPRNMYRDTPAAFAWDEMACAIAKRLIDKGWDLKIKQDRRAFAYMPLMHSENLSDQNLCVDLVDKRLNDEGTLKHARAHRDVIKQFGRFPHRNEILGRKSTTQEDAFLSGGGYSP